MFVCRNDIALPCTGVHVKLPCFFMYPQRCNGSVQRKAMCILELSALYMRVIHTKLVKICTDINLIKSSQRVLK